MVVKIDQVDAVRFESLKVRQDAVVKDSGRYMPPRNGVDGTVDELTVYLRVTPKIEIDAEVNAFHWLVASSCAFTVELAMPLAWGFGSSNRSARCSGWQSRTSKP